MSMNRMLAVASALFVTSACQYNNADLNYDELHTYCAQEWKPDLGRVPPDLAVPPASTCAAAKGLTGDAIVCVDFKDLANQTLGATPPTELPGWKFDATNCLEIASGKLQVKNFGTFVGTCSFTMPLTDLGAAANQKYQSVTLAVVQRVDLNEGALKQQTAQIYLGVAVPSNRLAFTSSTNPRQQSSYSLTRTDLSLIRGDTAFQPLFQLASPAIYSGSGWQIESIAVMGNQ